LNIPVRNILLKIGEELEKAKMSQSREAIQSRLLVIRSLCDVVLEERKEETDFTDIQETVPQHSFTDLELEKMMGIKKPQQKMVSNYLKEDDANGESIFDF
jgi:hypothetical protein